MTPVDVQRRRAHARAAGRRRPGAPGRAGAGATPQPDPTPRLFPDEPDRRREGATLEELVGRLWDGVLTEGRAACPLCGGEIVGRASAHARPTEGRCQDCGTTIG